MNTKNKKDSTVGKKTINILAIAENRKARFDYSIIETIEAGLELRGSEVKSLRVHGAQLKDSYVVIKNGEAYLQGAHFSPYKASSYMNHDPERLRKLLLSAAEIVRIDRAISEKGLTCIPLKMYFRGPWAKVEIALAKGKKAADKRDSIKSREVDREMRQARSKGGR